MKGVFYGFMEIYKTFSTIVVPSCFNSYAQFFFILTAANWIMITPIYKPQREQKKKIVKKRNGN